MEHKFKKQYGQNFLSDTNFLNSIAENAGLTSEDNILEIGAGAGALTTILAQRCKRIVSYEIDQELKPILLLNLEKYKNVELIFDDIMKVDNNLIREKFDEPFKVVANLPYYITTPILFKFLESDLAVTELVVMVQQEVAERIVADSGNKDYGILSVIIQSIADAKIIKYAPASMFYPRPNVDSAVIQIKLDRNKFNIEDFSHFQKVVKASFGWRRKTLYNCLQLGLGLNKEVAQKVIADLNLGENVRGEQLSIPQFILLSQIIKKIK